MKQFKSGEYPTFKLGDIVKWATPGMSIEMCESAPHLSRYVHIGTITRVIAPKEPYTNDSYGARSRNHESYEVKVKSKKFWPMVRSLRIVAAVDAARGKQ